MASDLAEAWDRCAGRDHPFVTRGFFEAALSSGSAVPNTGWDLQPVVVREAGRIVAMAPMFRKAHSWGEYVFDHSWAQAWRRAGQRYYPKLLVGVPFTPVPGPRLLVAPEASAEARHALILALEQACVGYSSLHVNFLEQADKEAFEAGGWAIRRGFQFHLHNPGFADFDAFLASLQSHRRKDIRRERRLAQACGLTLKMLTVSEITEQQWVQFHALYVANTDKKWGQAYLTPTFFAQLARALPDAVLLAAALEGDQLIAGALHLRGATALYGRNWGASRDVPFLHFELCYYMALDYAFAHKLARVEAGAQGEHKLQRGYLPSPTWSAHFIPDPRFRAAVKTFCAEESATMTDMLAEVHGPYRVPA